MKTKLITILLAALCALAFPGCASTNQKNAGAFLGKVSQMHINVTDFSQKTVTPWYNHAESVTALSWSPDHSFTVANLKANFTIPVPFMGISLLTWDLSASGISGSPDAAPAAVSLITQPSAPDQK